MKDFIVGLSKVALAILVIFLGIKLIPAILKFLFNLVVGFFSLSTFGAILVIILIAVIGIAAKIFL